MGLDPQLKQQLKQICAMSFGTATANDYGEIAVGSVATFYCRQESRVRTVERSDGTYATTVEPLLILDASVLSTGTPDLDTRIWLPGTSSGSAAFAKHAKFVEFCVDENGAVEHLEIQVS